MEEFGKKNVNKNNCISNNSISNIIKKPRDKTHVFYNIKTVNDSLTISNANKINDKLRKFLFVSKNNKNNTNILCNNKNKNKILDVENSKSINFKRSSKKNSSKIVNAKCSDTIYTYNNNFQCPNVKTENIVPKKSNKESLIINNNKKNKRSLNVKEQKTSISTSYLFKNIKLNKKEAMKAYKFQKKIFTNNCLKKEFNNSFSIDSEISNSYRNNLYVKEKTLEKYLCNNKNNNISTQSLNGFKTIYSMIGPNHLKDVDNNHKNAKSFNSRENKAHKATIINNNLFKKFNNDLCHPSKILLDENENSRFFFFDPKNWGYSLNNVNIYRNYFLKNNKTTVSISQKKNSRKKIKKFFKLKENDLTDNNENDNEYILKRFNTDNDIELDKDSHHLKTKSKNKMKYSDHLMTTSLNIKKSSENNQNNANFLINTIKSYKTMENGQNHLGINHIKNYNDKKDNILKKAIKRIINGNHMSKNKIYIQNSDTKIEEKNLSNQIEANYINTKRSRRKNNSKIKKKIYSTIDSILHSSTKNYNNMPIKKLDSIKNNNSRNFNHSMKCKIDSFFLLEKNLEKIKKKICDDNFDILEKYKNKKVNNKNDFKVKKKKNYILNKTNNEIKNEKETIINNRIKKNKFFEKKSKNEEKSKIKDHIEYNQFNKEIRYINDFNSEEELEEEFIIRDTSQSTNYITNINSQANNLFKKELKYTANLKLIQNRKIYSSLLFLSLYKEENILSNILNFSNYETLNKLCLLSKKYYKYIKPLIYKKIKSNLFNINKNKSDINNAIKKSVFQYSPLSNLSSVMVLKKYKDTLYELNEKYDMEIKKDLLRTAPNNTSFQYGKENYNKLYHILSAFSNYNKNIGYAQGLNFLAFSCINIYKKEIDAFIFLDGLVRKFKFENLFGINNNALNDKLLEIEKIVNKWCPEVNNHLQRINLTYNIFTCKWMITLFSNQMNIKYLLQLWDYLIIFGWKFFKGFAISVIKFNEKMILNSSLETIMNIMNNIFKTKEFEKNFYEIIDYTFYYIKEESDIL